MNITNTRTFTMEEENLICMFDTGSRTALISDLRGVMPDFDEPELREIAESALRKLDGMSDADFSALIFAPEYDSEDDMED